MGEDQSKAASDGANGLTVWLVRGLLKSQRVETRGHLGLIEDVLE